MSRLQALGIVTLCAAWGFADGLATRPAPVAAVMAALAGMACIVRGSPAGSARAEALAGAAGAAALHAGTMWPLPVVMAHLHEIPGAAPLASLVLAAVGVESAAGGPGRLLVETSSGTQVLALTWEAAALPMLLRLAVCVVMMPPAGRLAEQAGRWRTGWSRPLGAILLGAVLRMGIVTALVAGGAGAAVLYEPAITWLTFLPLAWLMPIAAGAAAPGPAPAGAHRRAAPPPDAGALPETPDLTPAPALPAPPRARALPALAGRPPRTRRPFLSAAALLAACGCAGGAAGWRPAGEPAGGRVLIDESRSDWEWTSIPFDHVLHGQRSLYNYALWRRWIEAHFDTWVSRAPLAPAILDGADVLVVKTPTAPYSDEEARLVERFVRRGGGLWLIGDHTNLFGMATVLNRLAGPYGLSFVSDDTFPLDHEGEDRFVPPTIAPHPILRGLGSYVFETSCSLSVPWSAHHIMIGRRLGSEEADYGHVNFFGDIRLQPSERFGVFTQAAALRHGRGRVIAFTDSTNFSNFSMLWPGRRELSLHMVDWLNRRGSSRAALWERLLPAAAIAAAAGALLLGLPRRWGMAGLLWTGLALSAATASAASSISHAAAEGPVPRGPLRTIAFDTEISTFSLASTSPVMSRRAPGWSDFNAFYIDAARSGLWPVQAPRLGESLRDHEAVVLINPVSPPSPARLAQVRSFLRRGGRLLVVDSARTSGTAAGAWVAPFGLRVSHRLEPVRSAEGPRVPAVEVTAAAGAAVVQEITGGATLAWHDQGAGRVVLLSDGALFSDRARGGVYVPADRAPAGMHAAQQKAIGLLLPDPGTSR